MTKKSNPNFITTEVINERLTVKPNPTFGYLWVEGAKAKQILKIRIYDQDGKTVYINDYFNPQSSINIHEIKPGEYTMRAEIKEMICISKIIKK